MQKKLFFLTILAIFVALSAYGQTESVLVEGRDTIRYKYTPVDGSATLPSAHNKGVFRKIYNYFAQSSTDKSYTKPFDVTFVGAPTYSSSTGLGLGIMTAGLYRIDKQNLALPPSTVSIFARATLKGVYTVGIEGVNIFKDDRDRLLYRLSFSSRPTDFWGIGYNAVMNNSVVSYTANKYQVSASYYHRLVKNLYIGTRINFDYIHTAKTPPEQMVEYLEGRRLGYSATGLSLLLEYDTRDFIPNPYKGVYISVQAMVRPKALGSIDDTSWRINGNAAYYQQLWSGAILAMEIYGEFNSQATPWVLYAQMGGQYRMRGYYEGQFIDRNLITVQAELRQRIWRRIGATVWGGAGNCFHSFDDFQWKQTIPNYGVGLRWEFKKRVNVRFDYGFGGKVQGKVVNGFLVSLNEAF